MQCEWAGQSHREPRWEQRAIEVSANKHSGGKHTIKARISDLHVQTNKQRHGPQSHSKKGFQAKATVVTVGKNVMIGKESHPAFSHG